MHTVGLLEQAVEVARRLGYVIRQEWLGGVGGGACELKGRRLLFLDLALDPREQLEQVIDALRRDPRITSLPIPRALHDLLTVRKSA